MSEANPNDQVLCPSCQTPNDQFKAFCQNCGAPIGSTATLDPMHTIQSEGVLFRKALDTPKPIVLVGMWIIFLPLLLISVYAAVEVLLTGHRFSGFIFFWALVGLTFVSFIILYRTTKNYIVARRKRS